MKKIIFALLFLIIVCNLKSQESLLKFNELNILINGVAVNNAHVMLKGDLKDVSRAWNSFAKDNVDGRMRDKDGVLIAEEIVVNQITDKRGDLMVYFFTVEDDVSFNIAYKLGYDVYINSNQYHDEYQRLEAFVKYFTDVYYDDFLPSYIRDMERNLKSLKKEMKSNAKQIKKNSKSQKKANKKLEKIESKYSSNESKIEKSEDEQTVLKLAGEQNNLSHEKESLTADVQRYKQNVDAKSKIVNNTQSNISNLSRKINDAKITLTQVKTNMKKRQ
jgi:hypothetical protein